MWRSIHQSAATVTVVAPTLKTVDISLKVTKGTGNADAIKSVLTKYFKENVFSTNYTDTDFNKSVTISYAQIGRIMLDNSSSTGVEDYESMTVNGGTKNIVVDAITCL